VLTACLPFIAISAISAASPGFAAENPPTTPPTQPGQGMMGGNGDMMNMMGQMTKMMDSCNKMMESANDKAAPATPPAKSPPG
jgi:hypothetical protein